jgi:hypothetical protein
MYRPPLRPVVCRIAGLETGRLGERIDMTDSSVETARTAEGRRAKSRPESGRDGNPHHARSEGHTPHVERRHPVTRAETLRCVRRGHQPRSEGSVSACARGPLLLAPDMSSRCSRPAECCFCATSSTQLRRTLEAVHVRDCRHRAAGAPGRRSRRDLLGCRHEPGRRRDRGRGCLCAVVWKRNIDSRCWNDGNKSPCAPIAPPQ